MSATALRFPVVGEVFSLTLGEVPDPMQMIKDFGYIYKPEMWRYLGRGVAEPHTRKFKLVDIGECANWKEVLERLTHHGKNPEGQWIEAFKAEYPNPGGKFFVMIADDSWTADGEQKFPYIDSSPFFNSPHDGGWESLFGESAESTFYEDCRPDCGCKTFWLVEVIDE